MSVLSHLAFRFAAHPENLATEALNYVLGRSPAARVALQRIVEATTGRSLTLARFVTQLANDDQSRPDLLGLDSGGSRRLVIEAKYWAGLTEAQPVGYLASMSDPGVLLFVAPEARLHAIWAELLRRVRDAGLPLQPLTDSGSAMSIVVGDNVMTLISWRALLGGLQAEAEAAGDHGVSADLRQLNALCEQMDTEAFLPLTSEEMTSAWARRVVQFGTLASDLTDLLVQEGLADVRGLRATSLNGSHGRYLRLNGNGAYLHFSAPKWSQYGDSPLWLSLTDERFKRSDSIPHLLRDAGLTIYEDDRHCHVPLNLPLGVERDAVVVAALRQLRVITQLLPQTAAATDTEILQLAES